jgi:hypothetical protein
MGDKYLTIDELLIKAEKSRKEFIKELETDDNIQQTESLDSILNGIKADKIQTNLIKTKFISELKSGLGNEIKTKPNVIIKREKSFKDKIKEIIRKIFTIF